MGLRQLGPIAHQKRPYEQYFKRMLNGLLTTAETLDGPIHMPHDGEILGVWLYRGYPGTSGSTIVDVEINNTTIFTTQSNRPTVLQSEALGKRNQSGAIEVSRFAKGDKVDIDLDQVDAGFPAVAQVDILVRFYPTE